MKVYFLSGLGANSKAFQFLDLSFCEPVFIEWIPPLADESLQHYAKRLRQNIKEESPVVVGVSFGGMLATEMAKLDHNVQAIIISSNKISNEFPAYLRVWKHFPLYKWLPEKLVKMVGKMSAPITGPKRKDQNKVFRQIISETNQHFNAWAIDAILNWENATVPENVIHIHGSADKLLPYKMVTPHYTIRNGTHLMIMEAAEELSTLLKRLVFEVAK